MFVWFFFLPRFRPYLILEARYTNSCMKVRGRDHRRLAAGPEKRAGPWPPWERGHICHHPPVSLSQPGPGEMAVARPGVEGMDTGCRCHCWCPASPFLLPSPPHRHHGRRAAPGEGRGQEQDKPLCQGLTFNRSQQGSCSATYETLTQSRSLRMV